MAMWIVPPPNSSLTALDVAKIVKVQALIGSYKQTLKIHSARLEAFVDAYFAANRSVAAIDLFAVEQPGGKTGWATAAPQQKGVPVISGRCVIFGITCRRPRHVPPGVRKGYWSRSYKYWMNNLAAATAANVASLH